MAFQHVPAAAPAPAVFHTVGIGASAGGLEALEQFLKNVPQNSGLAEPSTEIDNAKRTNTSPPTRH